VIILAGMPVLHAVGESLPFCNSVVSVLHAGVPSSLGHCGLVTKVGSVSNLCELDLLYNSLIHIYIP
jgi:hypothetical protein